MTTVTDSPNLANRTSLEARARAAYAAMQLAETNARIREWAQGREKAVAEGHADADLLDRVLRDLYGVEPPDIEMLIGEPDGVYPSALRCHVEARVGPFCFTIYRFAAQQTNLQQYPDTRWALYVHPSCERCGILMGGMDAYRWEWLHDERRREPIEILGRWLATRADVLLCSDCDVQVRSEAD